jgi:Berberine and berberine like
MADGAPPDWEPLRSRLSGGVLLPPDGEWDRARRPQMRRFSSNLVRLRQVKQSYDPGTFFRPLEPAGTP